MQCNSEFLSIFSVSVYGTCWQNVTKKNITVRAHSATYKIIIKVGDTLAHEATLHRIFLIITFWEDSWSKKEAITHNVRGKNSPLQRCFLMLIGLTGPPFRLALNFCVSGTNQVQRQGLTDPNRPSASQSVALRSLCIGTVGQTGGWETNREREWEQRR